MNYKTVVLSVAVAVASIGPASGQLLKKLGERAEKAAERTILNRADREVSKGTDKAIDEAMGVGKKGKEKDAAEEKEPTAAKTQARLPLFMGGMDDVPDTYQFSYRATMKIIADDDKDETAMQYWLEPDAAYFGTKALVEDAGDNIAVMDMENKAMVMFMDDGKQKTAMRIKGNQRVIDQYLKEETDDKEREDVKVTPIEGKTILGYHCKGFQMETEEGISKVWVTDEAPVGLLSGALQGDYVPNGMPNLGANALFMEMEYTPKKGKKDQVRMVCTELKAESLVIRKKDYQTMGGH